VKDSYNDYYFTANYKIDIYTTMNLELAFPSSFKDLSVSLKHLLKEIIIYFHVPTIGMQ
jgi:hypothetical protein